MSKKSDKMGKIKTGKFLNSCLSIFSTSSTYRFHLHHIIYLLIQLFTCSCTVLQFIGQAYLGAMCSSLSQSIVRDNFNFITQTVAAHEIGHR